MNDHEFEYREFFDAKYQVEDNDELSVRSGWNYNAWTLERVRHYKKTPTPGSCHVVSV